MLTVCTWMWGGKYTNGYVDKLQAGLTRHMKQEYQFRVFTPLPEDKSLTERPGCFARLRMFEPVWQRMHGLKAGDRLVCLDLDNIITRSIDTLFNRPEPFVILQGANSMNPCPFNGSVMMLRVGAHPEVWSDFSVEAASKVPFFEFPDDQGWLHYKLPNAAGWQCGPKSGIYAFQKRGWSGNLALPHDARMVCFFGHRDPAQFSHVPWVKFHWQ